MKNREDLTSEYAEAVVDGMDIDTLVMYAIDTIRDGLRSYSDEELHEEIARFFPELLEPELTEPTPVVETTDE